MTPADEIAPSPASQLSTTDRARHVVTWSLRVFGSIDLLAMVAVIMPVEWMRIGHRLCGMGEFPDGPLPVYLSRATALLWAFHGALLLFLASDVHQHRTVIQFVARATIVVGIVFVGVDLMSGIPWWWTALEGPVFAISGVWVLWWLKNPLQIET